MFLVSMFNWALGYCYKPVVIVHGVMSEADHLEDMKQMIEKHHPGTNVTLVHLYPDIESFTPLQRQFKYWKQKIEPLMKEAIDGIHFICHSQGGLICQGLIEETEKHNVHTFIALSSPLNGQFGVPKFVSSYIPWLKGEREKLSGFMYSTLTQDTFAISNYWKDPREEYYESYLDESRYLPILHNNPQSPRADDMAKRKKNFLELKKLVLIGGPDDGVITPWQSSLYGFYDEEYKIQDMKQQKLYQEDWFGLRTLFERGDVVMSSILGVKHIEWHGNQNVFKSFIEPWLI